MRTRVIANPKAAAGRVRRHWSALGRELRDAFGEFEDVWTTAPTDATRLARQAALDGVDRVVVVGGDGTVNEVVNGLMDFERRAPLAPDLELVIYPAGTGGDFVRSIGLGPNAARAWDDAESRAVDVGCLSGVDRDGAPKRHFFVNVASFGGSGLIVDKVNRTTKRFGGKASFYIGTLRGLWEHQNCRIRLRVDDGDEEELLVNTVAVANGRYFGGSMMIAPEARLTDGLLDVVIIGDVGAATFVRQSGALYRGEHLALPYFRLLRGRKVEVEPLDTRPVLLETDGELIGRLPAKIDVLPGVLRVLAPWNRAEAR